MDDDMGEDFDALLKRLVSLLWDEARAMDTVQLLNLLNNILAAAQSVNVNTPITVRAEVKDPEDHTLGGLLGRRIEDIFSAMVACPEFGDAAGNLGAGGDVCFAEAATMIAMGLDRCTDEGRGIRECNDREGTERGSPIDAARLRLAAAGAAFTMEPRTDQPYPRYIIRRTPTPTPT